MVTMVLTTLYQTNNQTLPFLSSRVLIFPGATGLYCDGQNDFNSKDDTVRRKKVISYLLAEITGQWVYAHLT